MALTDRSSESVCSFNRRHGKVKQMTLDLPDASFEVIEEDFSVVPVSSVPSELLAHLEPPLPLSAKPVVHPFSPANLDRAELEVFATLHRLQADLGEPVTVTRSSRDVQVGVWRLPAQRQKELDNASREAGSSRGIHSRFQPLQKMASTRKQWSRRRRQRR